MKKALFRGPVLALLILTLAGCSAAPSQAADGSAWSEDWVTLGPVLGVEPPGHELTLLDNNTALTADDMYYAAWTAGEPSDYTNAEGQETALYEAQLDVLVCGYVDQEHAQAAVEEWQDRQDGVYTGIVRWEEIHNDQRYAVASYTCGSDTNPYSRGISAFAVCGDYAVSAELNCREIFGGDEAEILADFLDGCHYGAGIAE